MPRKIVPISPDHPYHISARCINRDWFAMPLKDVWAIMEDYLFFINHAFNVKILGFALMQNHFHPLAQFPNSNISEAMMYFMRETSRTITKDSHRINQTYGGRFFRSLIQSQHHYLNVYKYVLRNPVSAGVCQRVEDYPFSTLRGLIGFEPLHIPLEEDINLFLDLDGTLDWLNETPDPLDIEAIKAALKRPIFCLKKGPKGKPHPLEMRLL